ncbi:hypothetical protein KCU88_g4945, partial [Aureobasidium melanogenum]
MAQRLFKQHVTEASLADIAHIKGVRSPDDGLISCTYTDAELHSASIQVCTTNLDNYPQGNSFMLYTDDENVDPIIPRTLQEVTDRARGKTVFAMLSELSQRLTAAFTSQGGEATSDIEEASQDSEVFDTDSDLSASEDEDFDFSELIQHGPGNRPVCSNPTSASKRKVSLHKMQGDVKILKEAGFRVGAFGDFITSGILCISIRMPKLGLSEEVMDAWGLRRQHYLLLLVHYAEGYIGAQRLVEDSNHRGTVAMHVGLCEHYKPTANDAWAIFERAGSIGEATTQARNDNSDKQLEHLFIGQALNQLLQERFFAIIKLRASYGLSWLGAETLFADLRVQPKDMGSEEVGRYQALDDTASRKLPAVVSADHSLEVPLERASLPLIMMQFVLRHFVRCPEFCLVCHCRVDDTFEALKPYVCTKPLCLYQYMALGFGPSLECEILNNPSVVDLLISCCYTAVVFRQLKDLPIGLGLVVPNFVPFLPDEEVQGILSHNFRVYGKSKKSFAGQWSPASKTIQVRPCDPGEPYATGENVKAGDWLVLTHYGQAQPCVHCRVQRVALPIIEVGQEIAEGGETPQFRKTPRGEWRKNDIFGVDVYCHNLQFDDFRHQAYLRTLLDILPSVRDMYEYLQGGGSLKGWSERIPESAVNLLRWIVASNRSCITEVDEVTDSIRRNAPLKKEDRVIGMDGWMQFRIAQGAPDKEKRFRACVMEQAATTGTEHPTLFAWHGSGLWNWHSILRQGLHYQHVVSGRRYGDGVYFSPQAQYSLGFSREVQLKPGYYWAHSMLSITQAISLNEVVNKPDDFVCSSPAYVVNKLDWIQTRYLFVKTKTSFKGDNTPPTEVYKQDPVRLAYGLSAPLIIPLSAVSKSRRLCESVQAAPTGSGKRVKTIVGVDQATAESREDDANSVVSDDDDLALGTTSFLADESDAHLQSDGASAGNNIEKEAMTEPRSEEPVTDFVPGTLNVDNIKFLEPPRDATSIATKSLMRLLQDALAVQDKVALASLGWYIDRDLVNNMYQWIVELHSFPLTLPLAQDMKENGISSIVLEMRFSNQFPFSPPFIRVVKPRFLPFAQGGGGNVTEGGAMCMEVLTNNGWSAAQSIESLLLQVRLAICDEERPARLLKNAGTSTQGQDTYGIGEAIIAYKRACLSHGWQVPTGFDKIQQE